MIRRSHTDQYSRKHHDTLVRLCACVVVVVVVVILLVHALALSLSLSVSLSTFSSSFFVLLLRRVYTLTSIPVCATTSLALRCLRFNQALPLPPLLSPPPSPSSSCTTKRQSPNTQHIRVVRSCHLALSWQLSVFLPLHEDEAMRSNTSSSCK